MQNIRICRSVAGLRHLIRQLKLEGKSIGFVPTMGALHQGHASLLKKARTQSDVVIASIYANPTQFNNKNDLDNYPHTEQEDIQLLVKEKTNIVFIPQTDDIYYNVEVRKIDYGVLTNTLEGAHRPGHFDGMSTIVRRLFQVVSPDYAYFGEKDWQQLAVVNHMCALENFNIQIIGCPIIREPDNLAMSSRNRRLTPTERQDALIISKLVLNAPESLKKMSVNQYLQEATKALIDKKLKPDYVKIVNSQTLEETDLSDNSLNNRILITAYCGEARLLDNGPI